MTLPTLNQIADLLQRHGLPHHESAVDELYPFFSNLSGPQQAPSRAKAKGRPSLLPNRFEALFLLADAYFNLTGRSLRPSFNELVTPPMMRFVRDAFALAGIDVSNSTIRDWRAKYLPQDFAEFITGLHDSQGSNPYRKQEIEDYWRFYTEQIEGKES